MQQTQTRSVQTSPTTTRLDFLCLQLKALLNRIVPHNSKHRGDFGLVDKLMPHEALQAVTLIARTDQRFYGKVIAEVDWHEHAVRLNCVASFGEALANSNADGVHVHVDWVTRNFTAYVERYKLDLEVRFRVDPRQWEDFKHLFGQGEVKPWAEGERLKGVLRPLPELGLTLDMVDPKYDPTEGRDNCKAKNKPADLRALLALQQQMLEEDRALQQKLLERGYGQDDSEQ